MDDKRKAELFDVFCNTVCVNCHTTELVIKRERELRDEEAKVAAGKREIERLKDEMSRMQTRINVLDAEMKRTRGEA